ncbi:MAG: hypothetical protein JWN98_2358 [Abditibacteriota bacterium]|nr:hypothetical protein [Abditibacteriota bacterium]
MAIDSEARSSSSSALTFGVLALILVVGAIAFFATRPADEPVNTTSTVVVPGNAPAPATNTTIIERDAPSAGAPVVNVVPGASTSTSSTTSSSSSVSKDVAGDGSTSTEHSTTTVTNP